MRVGQKVGTCHLVCKAQYHLPDTTTIEIERNWTRGGGGGGMEETLRTMPPVTVHYSNVRELAILWRCRGILTLSNQNTVHKPTHRNPAGPTTAGPTFDHRLLNAGFQ